MSDLAVFAAFVIFGLFVVGVMAFLVWLDWRLQQIADELRRAGEALTNENIRARFDWPWRR